MIFWLESGEPIKVRVDHLSIDHIRDMPGLTPGDRIGLACVIIRREVRAIRRLATEVRPSDSD